MSFFGFHPLIERWFRSRFAAPTAPQLGGWPSIAAGAHTLIAAPTGSGKTLTAFLAVIDRLLKEALAGTLEPEELRVVYVSPLRALSNDMHRNLQLPLDEILALAQQEGYDIPDLRVGLRTGDTPASQRAALVRRPPHLLVTTPESLYLMLTARKSRERFPRVETMIVDEIHALVRDKRGSHLALTMERLQDLCERPLQRIGLSATQKPIDVVARFLIGNRPDVPIVYAPSSSACNNGTTGDDTTRNATGALHATSHDGQTSALCRIVDVGHRRALDLAIETPQSELSAVCSHEQWAEINARIVELIGQHKSTLIFVNTRRLAERLTHQLTELLGEDVIGSHHGSLSSKTRLETERRLKEGTLKAVVATASLELGLDIGHVDLVIQIGSPRSIATFLQRVGRAGHSLGEIPKGRLVALSRDELMECMALIRAVRAGRLDAQRIPEAPLDILAQQIVAEVAGGERSTDELFDMVRRAWPYRQLDRAEFDRILDLLSEGISRGGGRSRVYLHHDHVGRRVRARRSALLAATSNGGAIPEIASYRVVLEPDNTVVGTLDEEFAVESQRGDVFLLGNTSWQIVHVRGGDVTVRDAHGAPPNVPFWQGEAPGRTLELSEEVSRLREDLEARLEDRTATEEWLIAETSCDRAAAEQITEYATAQKAAIGLLPSQRRIVFERFFDETGGMQVVIHAPFGAAINRGWGYALRKRFCRSFDFELQAAADDDGILLSIGPQHSFPLESLFSMLRPDNVRALLEQAVLAQPLFQVRWRWNATRALLVMRQQNGTKVPPPLQRFRADDLLTAVFPQLTGCQENVVGDLPVPDHPLVRQTMDDCLQEAIHLDALIRVLETVEQGEFRYIARDTREPSPFSYELINSNVYTFLDGGEVQERRARAVSTPRSVMAGGADDLGRLDPDAIAQVLQEAEPLVRSADELHDLLLSRIVLPVVESRDWDAWYTALADEGRATTIALAPGLPAWVATERLPAALAAYPAADPNPPVVVPASVRHDWSNVDARVQIVRGLMESCGPITAPQVAGRLALTEAQADAALEALEGEGLVLRGQFTPGLHDWTADLEGPPPAPRVVEWCHRRLLARIHRLTLQGLRRQISPVGIDVFHRFLTRQHGLLPGERRSGSNGVYEVVSLLQGLDIPAVAWERDLLPLRIEDYDPGWLDELCLSGEVGWGRMFPPRPNQDKSRAMVSLSRVAPMSLFLRSDMPWLLNEAPDAERERLSTPAQELVELLAGQGAMFASDLMAQTRMLPSQLAEAIGELISRGLVTADGFHGLRQMIAERTDLLGRTTRRPRPGLARRRATGTAVGRWSLWRRTAEQQEADARPVSDVVEQWAWQLLRRWGVVFRDLLEREDGAPRWWELLQVYRRLEARGEIRGGRFVAGVAGEQFALAETITVLRRLRDEGPQGELVTLSAADPLNLVGILTSEPRVPRTASNRLVYLDGVAVAARIAGELQRLTDLDPAQTARVRTALEAPALTVTIESVPRPPAAAPTEPVDDSPAPPPAPRESRRKTASAATPRRAPRPLIR